MKKYLISSFGVLCLVLCLNTITFAETSTTSTASTLTAPMVVNIGPNGNVMLRGEVKSVGTDSLVVKSWGMEWTVKVLTTTQLVTANKVITDIGVGDFVGVMGDISTDGTFVINAKVVRVWGQKIDKDKDGIPDNQDGDVNNDGKPETKDWKGLGDGFFKHFSRHMEGAAGVVDDHGGSATCLARPTCLDTDPKCTVAEPVGGWCKKEGETRLPKLPPQTIDGTPRACTQEAKLCKDGSSVGRVGPKCEFAECPESHGGSSNSGSGSNN